MAIIVIHFLVLVQILRFVSDVHGEGEIKVTYVSNYRNMHISSFS